MQGSLIAVSCLLLLAQSASAEPLKGRIEHTDEILRVRPAPSLPSGPLNGQTSMRVARPTGGFTSSQPVLDREAFSPLAGRAKADDLRLGVVRSDNFAAPPRNFDLGAERQSRELMLAWERWHKQLSQAIYQRWSERAEEPGRATVRVTVTRNRHLTAHILRSDGGPAFEASLMEAIMSLDQNPGLTFPSKSQRQQVTFEADYVAATNVRPGYSWIKNDFEKVREDW